MARQHIVDLVLILGDLADEKDRHPAELVNLISDHFFRLAGICPVIVLRGNHDYLSPESPFFAFLQRIGNVAWINEPTGYDDLLGKNTKALFLPHTNNWERDWKELDFKGIDYIFTHQSFQNAESEGGFKLPGIPTSVFPPKSRVIAGDVHLPQKIGPVEYVGSPYTIDFGDDFQPRVILLEDGKQTSIPCPGPQKRLISITSEENFEKLKFFSVHPGDILKVRVQIKDMTQWPKVKDEVKAWGAKHGYIIHALQPGLKEKRSMSSKAAVSASKSDEQILRDYAQHRGIEENTLKTGLKLLKQS